MTIAVIGGSGFVGRRLCARLVADSPDSRLCVVARHESPAPAGATFAHADVRNIDALAAAIPVGASIVNLAAAHGDDVRPASRYEEVNVHGATNVCDAARRCGARKIVFVSSVAVYGLAPPGADETRPCAPVGPYGASKLSAEGVYRAWQAEHPTERTLVIVRAAPVFGEGGGGNLATLLRRIVSSRFLPIGDGRSVKSLAYVENLAAFLAFSLAFAPGVHVHNYADKPDMTVAELAASVRREAGLVPPSRLRIRYPVALAGALALDVVARLTGRDFGITASRVRRLAAPQAYGTSIAGTGFVAPVPLEEALRRTVRSITAAS